MSGAEQSASGGGGLSLATTTAVMVAAVIAFFLLFLVLFFLYLRSKSYWGAIPVSSGAARSVVSGGAPAAASRRRVLDAAAVAALPAADLVEGGECAVCLCELAEGGVQLLPGCGHAFHLECIDLWFRAHSTCPLCRSAVTPVADPGAARRDLGESSQLSGDRANGGRAGSSI